MDVSILIINHDEYTKFLPLALSSAYSQIGEFSREIIIVNCGAPISFNADIDKVKLINMPNINLSTACNEGIKIASGKYIVRIDSDDFARVEMIDNLFLMRYHADIIWCDYQCFGSDNSIISTEKLEHACGVLFKKEMWKNLGGYDESLKYQESYDFWKRAQLKGFTSHHVKKNLYLYRRGHGSMSSNVEERAKTRQSIDNKYRILQ